MDDSGVLSIINNVVGGGQAATASLPAVLSQAAQSGMSPDQEAQWQRLAKESNVPVGLIRNGAPVKLMQLQQQASDLPATNPVTARTLMDPDNAAVAHDDIGTLTRLEDLARNGFGSQVNAPISILQFGTARDQAEANYFAREYGTKPYQAIQGGTGKLVTKLAFPVAAAVDAVNGDDDYKEFASQLYDAFSQVQQDSAADPSQTFGGKLIRSVQELVPMVLSGGAGLAEIVGQATNDKYDELTAKGVDPDTALAMAMKSGMTAYAMTKLPFGGTSLTNSLVRGAMLNPAFGALDRGLEKAGLNYVGYDKQADAINLLDPETMAHDLAMGLLFGAQHAIQSGRPVMGDGLMESLAPFYDQYQAGRRADALTEIGKVVQDSKVNNRAPDLVQQHLSNVAADYAGIDNAYVPVNRWNESFQSAGLDPAVIANEMLSNPEAYHEANKTGSDIVIPFGEFTGKLSGLDQYGELVKDAKLSLGDTSLREAEAHVQAVWDNADNGGGFIDTLKNMFSRSQEAVKGNESYSKVYDDLVGQQLGIGTERGTAEHNAQLVANAFRVLGDRAGVDPYELYSNYNLKLTRPMDSALTDRVGIDTSIDPMLERLRAGDLPKQSNPATSRAESVLSTLDSTAKTDGGNKYPAAKDSDSVARTLFSNARGDGENPEIRIFHPEDNVKSLLQNVTGHLVVDGAKNLYQSGNVPVSHDFVPAPDGRYVFGEITPEIGAAIRRQSAPILLRKGNEQEGKIHIERPERLKQLQDAGYGSAEELVDSVVTGCDAIYQGQKGNLLLAKKNGKNSVIYIQLTPSEHGDFYDVKTAAVVRGDFFDKKKPLWERAQTNPPGNGSPMRDLSGQSSSFDNKPLWENAGPNASTEDYQSPLIPGANAAAFEKRIGDKTTTDTLALTGKDDTASLPTDSSLFTIINSKPSDVNTLFQSAISRIAADEVRDLSQSGNVPVSHDFVPAPDGRYVFGEITPEIGASIGRQSAPILLRNGNEKEGKIHIERPERLKEIQAEGYDSAESMVDAVVSGCDAIYKGQKGNLLLVKKGIKDSVLYVQLAPSKHADFYDVKTASVMRDTYFKNKEPLWERAPTDQPGGGSPLRDLSGQSGSFESILHQSKEDVKRGFDRLDSNSANSKPSDVNTLLQSAVNHLAADGVKELYQSDKPPVSEDSKGNLPNNLNHDADALWAKLKAPRLPGSEALGAEPSRGDESSTLKESIPNKGNSVNIKIIDNDQKEAAASATSPSSNDRVKKVVTGVIHSAITRIKTPADAAHIAFALTKRAQEAAIAIVTDAKGNVLGIIQHSTGGLNSTTISPRDLLGVVHDFPGAAEVWFAHNHPSGNSTLSREDWEMTSELAALLDGSGIKSRGMIVVSHEEGAAWSEGKGGRSKNIPLGSLKTDKERTNKIETYDREFIRSSPSEHLTDPSQENENTGSSGGVASGIIILDARNRPVSVVPMSLDEMAKLKTGDPATGSSAIMSAFHKANGWGMIMFAPVIPDHHAAVQNMVSFGNMFGGKLLDVLESESGRSFKLAGIMPEASNHFFQGGDDKLGYIRFDNTRNFEIGLLKDANLSTFIHESGHFFTEVLGDLAARPDAPQQIKDDYAALLKFAGVDSRDAIQTEHHEKLAQAFEKYIMEGHAPSVELHGMFQRMKAWMISVYKDMTALNVQLNPEVRDVFDRMLASDSEIERMRDMEDMRPLFASAEDAGMSQAEFELYRKDAEQAGELAKEQLLRKLMAEKDREQKSWWKDERKKTWAEVEAGAKDDPIYQTYQVLTTGKTFDGRAMGDIKLSRADLVKQYGEAFVKKLPREFQRVYSKEGGLHPDAVAEMAGFGSGDEMVRKMAGAPKLKDYVKAETDRRMRERYGDMMTDGSIHEQALKDVHNDAQAKVMRAELMAIQRKAREFRPVVKAAEAGGTADAEATARRYAVEGRAKETQDREDRDAMLGAIPPVRFFKITASEAMGAKRVAEIQPHLYAYAARAAARESFEATARGDYEKAGAAKYRELLNHYLYKEAARASDFVDKMQAYATRMGTMKEPGKFGQAGGRFLDQIRAILDRYSFNRISGKEADEQMQHREPLDAFLRRMNNEEGVELPIPDAVRQEVQRTNYRDLSMEELREVYYSMRMLEHAARQVNQVNAEGRKVEVSQAALSMSNMLLRSIKGAADMARKSDGAASLLDRVKDVNLDGSVLLPEFMFERFDGLKKVGPWHEFIWDRYNDAADHQIRLREMLFPKVMEYAHGKAIDRSMGKIHIDSLNADLVKDDIIAIALNCGNESNLDKLMKGGLRFKVDEAPTPLNHEALQELLSHLSANELDVVNGIWKTIDLLKPEAAESARKRTGVEPNWIEAQPMQVKNGTLEGGYYPVKYDAHYSAAGEKQSDPSSLDQMFNKYAGSSTMQGDMNERTPFAAPMSLDWQSVVSRHLDGVITEISHWQFVTDTQRLLKRPEVKDAIQDRLGPAYYKNLLDWVRYTVDQDNVSSEASDNIERFREQIRSNLSAYALGFKVADAVDGMEIGVPLRMRQVKIASAFKGIMQYLRNPVEATRFATLASDYMRNIDKDFDRDITQALYSLHHGVADDIRHWSIAARAFLQKIGAVMAWHAGYIDAQEQGMQGKAAVRNADSICRMTQGSDRDVDASAVQRNACMEELARFIGPRIRDYLDRAGIGPERDDEQKAQEWLAVLQPTVSDRIAKILKPSINFKPFAKEDVKQSGDQVFYQSLSGARDRIATVIDATDMNPAGHVSSDIVAVDTWLSDIAKENGLDIAGYRHSIDNSAVRHILKKHGDEKTEISRGQLPITRDDILNIPVLVSSPDKVVFGSKTKQGRDEVVFLKRMQDGSILYLEEVRTGKKNLAAVSMRKYPATTRAESILSSLGPNVRNDGGVFNLKIAESPVSVKANDSNFQIGLATLLAGYAANAMISGMMSGKRPDKLDKLPSWNLAQLTLGLFDGFPLMRDVAGYAEGGTTIGKDKEMRRLPVLQWSKDVVDGFTKTVEAITDDGEWNKSVIRDAKAEGGATGLPALAGSTVGRYINDVLSGDYTPEHTWAL